MAQVDPKKLLAVREMIKRGEPTFKACRKAGITLASWYRRRDEIQRLENESAKAVRPCTR